MQLKICIKRSLAHILCSYTKIHLYHHGGSVLEEGYVVGHEPMGIVEEVGSQVQKLKKGDRVVIPFNIGCGHCHFCQNEMESQCDNSSEDTLYPRCGYHTGCWRAAQSAADPAP